MQISLYKWHHVLWLQTFQHESIFAGRLFLARACVVYEHLGQRYEITVVLFLSVLHYTIRTHVRVVFGLRLQRHSACEDACGHDQMWFVRPAARVCRKVANEDVDLKSSLECIPILRVRMGLVLEVR